MPRLICGRGAWSSHFHCAKSICPAIVSGWFVVLAASETLAAHRTPVTRRGTMIRLFCLSLLALSLAAPAGADLTLTQTVTGKGLGVNGQTTATTYLKGNKMRSETQVGDRTQTTIFDLDAQKMFIFDSKKKEADVWDMAAFAAELSKSVDTSAMKASLKPNGQTKQIAGQTASGYDLEI